MMGIGKDTYELEEQKKEDQTAVVVLGLVICIATLSHQLLESISSTQRSHMSTVGASQLG
jgi:hypothetical protein